MLRVMSRIGSKVMKAGIVIRAIPGAGPALQGLLNLLLVPHMIGVPLPGFNAAG
jgi:hypothetical protein